MAEKGGLIHTTGSRKESTARIYLRPGSGRWDINGRPLAEYFPRSVLIQACEEPLRITDALSRYDVVARVEGGGLTGQAGAVRMGVARALAQTGLDLRTILRRAGMLRRDARMVERKKYGHPKARKRFQFSKR